MISSSTPCSRIAGDESKRVTELADRLAAGHRLIGASPPVLTPWLERFLAGLAEYEETVQIALRNQSQSD